MSERSAAMNKGKENYQNIPLPDGLSDAVRKGIKKGKRHMEKKWIDIRDNKDVESLKMYLAYASVKGEYQKWNPTTAKDHQDEMLEVLAKSLK